METTKGTVVTEHGMKTHKAFRFTMEGHADYIYTDCRVGRSHKLVMFQPEGYRRVTCLSATCRK